VAEAAAKMVSGAAAVSEVISPLVRADAAQVARVLTEIGETCRNLQVVAKAEAAQRDELSGLPEVVASAPELDADIHDLGGLLRLGKLIWS
jgi:hypothetical protein